MRSAARVRACDSPDMLEERQATMHATSTSTSPAAAADPRWLAIAARDRAADGEFFYSVATTGVYCRPSCAARRPNPRNVRFHRTAADAARAGFRPCKRCRPDAPSLDERRAALIADACRAIEAADVTPGLHALARRAGLSPHHFHRIFKAVTGVTPKDYAAAHRRTRVRDALASRPTVTEAIYEAGFNSGGRFYAASKQLLGMTPTAFRAGGARATIRFAVGDCSLGAVLVAASEAGVCAILLGDDPDALVRDLQDRFPRASFVGGDRAFERTVAKVVGFDRRSVGRGRPAAGRPRHRVSAAGVERAARDPGGIDAQLRRCGRTHRRAGGGARRRPRLRRQPAGGGHSLPSRRPAGRGCVRLSLGRRA